MRRSVIASSFTASLELAREGLLELRQEGPSVRFTSAAGKRGLRAARDVTE